MKRGRNIKRIDDPRRPRRGGRKPLVLEEDGFRAARRWMEDVEPEEEEAPTSIEPGILRIFEDEDSRMHAHDVCTHLPLSVLSTLTIRWIDEF